MKYLFYTLCLSMSLFTSSCNTTQVQAQKNHNKSKTTAKTVAKTLEKPPFTSYFQSPTLQQKIAKVGESSQALQLSLAKENIHQDSSMVQWLKDNNLNLPFAIYHDHPMAKGFKKPISQDTLLTKFQKKTINGIEMHLAHSLQQENYIFLFYGSAPNELHVIEETWCLIILEAKTMTERYVFDFSNYKLAPEYIHKDKNYVKQNLLWAQIEDGILYVSNAHATYAQSSRGMNAYITAIDLAKGNIYWRSQPLVCNSMNFLIKGQNIISTYGFNREGSEVFAINKVTGKMVNKLDIEPKSSDKKYISFLFDKGNEVYLYAYNKSYIVKIE